MLQISSTQKEGKDWNELLLLIGLSNERWDPQFANAVLLAKSAVFLE